MLANQTEDIKAVRHFAPYILWRVVPPTVLLMVLVGLFALTVTRALILGSVHESIERVADNQRERVLDKIMDVKGQALALATNDLIINGLIDTLERDRYLPLFFRSLSLAGTTDGRIVLRDFKGREILSNQHEEQTALSYESLESLSEGLTVMSLTPSGLFVAVPVMIHGLMEGALTVSVSLSELATLLDLESLDMDVALVAGGKLLLSSTGYRKHWESGGIPSHEDRLMTVRTLLEDSGVEMFVGRDRDQAMAPVRQLARHMLGTGLAGVFALIAAIFAATRLAVREVNRLGDAVKGIVSHSDLQRRVEPSGPRELRELSLAFNRTLEDLERTTISRETLRESEERWKFALQGANDGIWDWDVTTNRVFYSEQWKAMLGYAGHEIAASLEAWRQQVHPEDIDRAQKSLQEHLDGVTPAYQSEFRMHCKDGGYKWILARGKVMQWADDGSPSRVIGTHTDITERRSIEEALVQEKAARMQAEEQQLLLSALGEGVFGVDAQGRCTFINPAALAMLGLDASEVLGRSPDALFFQQGCTGEKFFCESFTDDAGNLIGATLKDGRPRSTETLLRHKSGFEFPTFLIVTPKIQEGKLLGAVCAFQDTTQRKGAEAALLRAHHEMSQLVASIPLFLIILDKRDRVIRWNQEAQVLFGREAAEVEGFSLWDSRLPLSHPQVREAVVECRRESRPVQLTDLPYTRMDGAPGFLELTVNAVRPDLGERTQILILGSDVTHLRIMESQLLQAQKLESIGQLAAGIAHEINTPVQFVSDNTVFLENAYKDLFLLIRELQCLAEEVGEEPSLKSRVESVKRVEDEVECEYLEQEVPRAIEQSLEGLRRVTEIVRSMKAFAHPGTEDFILIDVNEVLRNTVTISRNEWKYVAEMVLNLDPDLPHIHGYGGELSQSFLNIITNGAQAMREMAEKDAAYMGRMTISTCSQGDSVEIRITDTGPGMSLEIRRRIFDPFFTTKQVGRGTGQGLSIAHAAIVQKHKGSIVCESEPGYGTTFIIRLPVEQVVIA